MQGGRGRGSAEQEMAASGEAVHTGEGTLTLAGPKRWLLLGAGYVFFALGLIGIVVPLMPTVIFWILAAACFARSCPRMRARLFSWPGVGPTIESYLTRGELSVRSKRAAVLGLTAVGALSLYFLSGQPSAAMFVVIVLVAVAVYIWTRPNALPAGMD